MRRISSRTPAEVNLRSRRPCMSPSPRTALHLAGGAEISQTRKCVCCICLLAVAVSHLVSQKRFRARSARAAPSTRADESAASAQPRLWGGRNVRGWKVFFFNYTIPESARKTLVRAVEHFLRSRFFPQAAQLNVAAAADFCCVRVSARLNHADLGVLHLTHCGNVDYARLLSKILIWKLPS